MAVPVKELYKEVQDMGYITAIPRKTPTPSFYRLADGTILSALFRILHLLKNPTDPNNIIFSSVTEIQVFVPTNKRKPHGKQLAHPQDIVSSVVDEDVECEPLREEFNVYDLSNGKVLSVKTIVAQIRKTDLYNREGEPIYNVDSQPLIKVKNK